VRAFYYTAVIEDQEIFLDPPADRLAGLQRLYSRHEGGKRIPRCYKLKGNMNIELAVDAMELAEHIDEMWLFSEDGNFRSDRAMWGALLAYKRGEPRVCAMVKALSSEEEDRRRLFRERTMLIAERAEHVNRIKGLLVAQGICDDEPLHRDRRTKLGQLKTGDGRPLPSHLKSQVGRELDRLELILEQIKPWRGSGTPCLQPQKKIRGRVLHRLRS
jgi:hypothetical protein